MALDPYSLCPCGNGKKVKFCCLDIAADMEKVGRLKSNNQTAQALNAVEKVREKHPDNAWAITTQAALLNDAQRFDEARDALVVLLKSEPSHALGNALYAMTEFNLSGWPASKKIVHRAFKACVKHRPDAVYSISHAVADFLLDEDAVMAARQHLAIAMRFAPRDVRQEVFVKLMEADGDSSQFFPFRGPYSLHTKSVAESVREPFEKAMRVGAIGCFSEAADALQTLVTEGDWGEESVPTSLLSDIGILHAWDNNLPAAAQALRDAAASTDDVDDAAESLALAALLDIHAGDDSAPLKARQFRTDKLSQVVSALGEHSQIVTAETNEDRATLFLILDRDVPESYEADQALDDVALIVARLSVVDTDAAGAEGRPQLTVFGVDNGELDSAVKAIQEACGDEISEANDDEEKQILGRVSAEIEAIRWEPYFPPKTSGVIRRALSSARWEKVFDEIWPTMAATALGGKAPADGGHSEAAMKAALIVLDAVCDTHRIHAPLAELRERYDVSEPTPLEVNEDLPLNTLTILQLMRVPMAALSDDQARLLLQRAVLTGHNRFASETLTAAIERGVSLDGVIAEDRAYEMLAEMSQQALKPDAAIEWVQKAIAVLVDDRLTDQSEAFEQRLRWKLSELKYRLDAPHEDSTRDLLRELWENYGQKVPELRDHLNKIVGDFEMDPPWSDIVIAGAEPAGAGGEQKLWLPGQ